MRHVHIDVPHKMIALIEQRYLVGRLQQEKRLIEDHLPGRTAGPARGGSRNSDFALLRLVGIFLQFLRRPRLEILVFPIRRTGRAADVAALRIDATCAEWMFRVFSENLSTDRIQKRNPHTQPGAIGGGEIGGSSPYLRRRCPCEAQGAHRDGGARQYSGDKRRLRHIFLHAGPPSRAEASRFAAVCPAPRWNSSTPELAHGALTGEKN